MAFNKIITMKKIFTTSFLLILVAMSSCTTAPKPQTVTGTVIDASMNNIFIKTSAGDSLWLSTMNADPTKVSGVLIDDSVSVIYKDSAEINVAVELTVLKHSPYFFIAGSWVEPNPIDATQNQGFTLVNTGDASSINMATLVYKSWNMLGFDSLVLSGQSIGNKQTIDFCDTMRIVKLDADSLVLANGGAIIYNLGRAK